MLARYRRHHVERQRHQPRDVHAHERSHRDDPAAELRRAGGDRQHDDTDASIARAQPRPSRAPAASTTSYPRMAKSSP